MAQPSISVVIPCYNYARYVRRAVESVARQPEVDAEIVVIDDCSTDESAPVLAELAMEYENVRVVRHEVNQGLIATINHGIELINGQALLVLSADDCLGPGSLAKAARAFELQPEVGLVFGSRMEFVDASELPAIEHYERRAIEPPPKVHVHDGDRWVDARCRQGINPVRSPEVFVRTSVQRTVGLYDAQCRHTSDLNMWLRIAMASDVAYIEGPPLAYYRHHGLNMSTVEFGDLATDLRERWIAYMRAIEASDAGNKRQERWRSLAARSLGTEAMHEARRAVERDYGDDVVALMLAVAKEFGHAVPATDPTAGAPAVPVDRFGRIQHRLRWWWWLKRLERVGL